MRRGNRNFFRMGFLYFFFPSLCGASSNGGFAVSQDIAPVAHLLTDPSHEALLWAGFWQNPDGTAAPSAPETFYGLNWTGTASDWLGMYDPLAGENTKATGDPLFFVSERVAGGKAVNVEGGFLQLGKNRSASFYGSEPIVLYGKSQETQEAIGFADNATYTLQYRVQFVYSALDTHVLSGLRHGALAAVAPPVVWAEKNASVAFPRALAAVYNTGLPERNDSAFNVHPTLDHFDDFHEDAAAVGFHLEPTFFCLNRKCCDGRIPRAFYWQNFETTIENISESAPFPPEKCDWRFRSDAPGENMFVDEAHLPFPEHTHSSISDPRIPWEKFGSTLYSRDWYTVTLTLLPPGYIAGVELPLRAYNFSFTGPHAGMLHPQTFVGIPPAQAGLGVGIGGQHGGANICNVTLRRTRPMSELRAMALRVSQTPAPPGASGTDPAMASTGGVSSTEQRATGGPSSSPGNATFPGNSSAPEKEPGGPFASGKNDAPTLHGPFFISAVVFLLVALSFAACSALKTYKANSLLSSERAKILTHDAEAARAWNPAEEEGPDGVVLESVYAGGVRNTRASSQSAATRTRRNSAVHEARRGQVESGGGSVKKFDKKK